jgi:zinc/manganese transport system substrate-binding protein
MFPSDHPGHRLRFLLAVCCIAVPLVALASCSRSAAKGGPGQLVLKGRSEAAAARRPTIVATYAILASIAREVAGPDAAVVDMIPNGLDPHEWEPSARDVETLMHADLVVANGLGLEGGMERALSQARASGRRFFTAADHIQVRRVGQGEGIPSGDPDQALGAEDPHFWTDPLAVKAVADALASELKADFGIDASARAAAFDASLLSLDKDVRAMCDTIPAPRRVMVTGHESLGYFAQRYGFRLIGALVPSLSSEAEVSASWLSTLKGLIERAGTKVIFTELGTPRQVVDTLATETGARAVPLVTHALPESGSYLEFERNLATTITESLR